MAMGHLRDEKGQALAVVAVGALVLAAAMALTIDTGYGFLQRRIAQNEADKVALEVGRLLATSVERSGSSIRFRVTQGAVCTLARAVNARDQRPTPQALRPASLSLTFESPSGSTVKRDCPSSNSTRVPQSTRTVRVQVQLTYKALLASLLRQPAVTVGAVSRVAVAGAPYTVDPVLANGDLSAEQYGGLAHSATAIVRTWPLSRLFNKSDFSAQACGPFCDPATARPLRFSTGGARSTGVQLLDLSKNSSRSPGGVIVPQLLTDPGTAAGTPSLADRFATPFDGAIGLNTEWDDVPSLKSNRDACDDANTVLPWRDSERLRVPPRPSCESDGRTRGDWIETVDRSIGLDLVQSMQALIAREGGLFPYSGSVVPSSWGSPNAGHAFGRAVVVWIYIWDCAQQFEDGEWREGNEDDKDKDNQDKDKDKDCSTANPDRVHAFTVVPITFYAGLVSSNAIEGYWGGGFVDPSRCQAAPASCPPLTPIANSSFLVAEDVRWDPMEDGLSDEEEEGDQNDDVWWDNWWTWWNNNQGNQGN
jgi:hypothetical protein